MLLDTSSKPDLGRWDRWDSWECAGSLCDSWNLCWDPSEQPANWPALSAGVSRWSVWSALVHSTHQSQSHQSQREQQHFALPLCTGCWPPWLRLSFAEQLGLWNHAHHEPLTHERRNFFVFVVDIIQWQHCEGPREELREGSRVCFPRWGNSTSMENFSPELVKQANAEACGWLGASLTYKNSGDYTAGSQATSTVPYVKKMA